MATLRGKLQVFACRSALPYTEKLIDQIKDIAIARKKEIKDQKLNGHVKQETDVIQDILNEGIHLGKAKVVEFDDGEMDVLIDVKENVRDKDVFLVQNSFDPASGRSINTNILETFIFIDALRRAKAKTVTLVSLYYPYARGDKQHGKDGIPAKLLANLFQTTGLNNLIAMDLHADQILGFFDSHQLRVEHLHATPLIIHYLKDNVKGPMKVAAPDTGAAKRAQYLAKALNVGMIMAYKRRSYEKKHEIDEIKLLGLADVDEVVIIDDMVASGGSVVKVIEILKEQGVKRVTVACTHPLLIGKAIERFDKLYADKESPFYRLIGTDSIHQELKDKEWYVELDTSKFVAKAIYETHISGSVSPLHEPDCVEKFDLWVD